MCTATVGVKSYGAMVKVKRSELRDGKQAVKTGAKEEVKREEGLKWVG